MKEGIWMEIGSTNKSSRWYSMYIGYIPGHPRILVRPREECLEVEFEALFGLGCRCKGFSQKIIRELTEKGANPKAWKAYIGEAQSS